MRKSVREFVKICAETLTTPEDICEFGSLQVPGQEELADLRPLFPGKNYVGADMREGKGVDLILNLHHIDLPSESVGTVLILDTLEHVEFPRKAIKEAYRILKLEGIIILTSVMNFPIHEYPQDYWRFTPEAFRSLLAPFSSVFVDFAGEPDFPHLVVGIGFKQPPSKVHMDLFLERFERWKKHWKHPAGNTWRGVVSMMAPPIALAVYRKIRSLLAVK